MDEANEMLLVDELRVDEGVDPNVYIDSLGNPSIGVGNNLNAHPLPEGWTPPLTDEQIDQLLEIRLDETFADLDRSLPWWRTLNDVRQRVISNLCFNMGITRLLGFVKALTAARQGRYADSADELLNSAWAHQVGIGTQANPGRALRLANMMRNGT